MMSVLSYKKKRKLIYIRFFFQFFISYLLCCFIFTLFWKCETLLLFFSLHQFFWFWVSLWFFGLPVFCVAFLILKSSFLFPYFKYTSYLEDTYEWFGNYFILVNGHLFFTDMIKLAVSMCTKFIKNNI